MLIILSNRHKDSFGKGRGEASEDPRNDTEDPSILKHRSARYWGLHRPTDTPNTACHRHDDVGPMNAFGGVGNWRSVMETRRSLGTYLGEARIEKDTGMVNQTVKKSCV